MRDEAWPIALLLAIAFAAIVAIPNVERLWEELRPQPKLRFVFTRTASRFTWTCNTGPVSPGKSGDRYFFVDDTGVIRFSTTGPAGPTSTAIGG